MSAPSSVANARSQDSSFHESVAIAAAAGPGLDVEATALQVQHLPGTLDGVRRLPESLRPALLAICDGVYAAARTKLNLIKSRNCASLNDASAKQTALFEAGYAGGLAWHSLTNAAELRRAAQLLQSPEGVMRVAEYLESLAPSNVFVQANKDEQSEAYLLRVTAVLEHTRYSHILLDANVIDSRDDASRLEVARRLGILGCHVSVAEPEDALKHGSMRLRPLVVAETAAVAVKVSVAPVAIANRLDALKARKAAAPFAVAANTAAPSLNAEARRPRMAFR